MKQETSKDYDFDILSEKAGESNNTSFSYDNLSIVDSLLDSESSNLSVKDDTNTIFNQSINNSEKICVNPYLSLQQFSLINYMNKYNLFKLYNENQNQNFNGRPCLNGYITPWAKSKPRPKPENEIIISKILSGQEKRCCVKLCPIPNNYSPFDIIRLIDKYLKTEKGKRIYNSVYVPLGKEIGKNKGYCFVNLVSPKYVVTFYEIFNGLYFNLKNCKKPCFLVFSDIQNINFSNEDALKRPIIFTDVVQTNNE